MLPPHGGVNSLDRKVGEGAPPGEEEGAGPWKKGESLVVVVVASETEKRRLRRCCVELRRSLAMLRGQITSEVSNCEGCVVHVVR